MTTSFQEEQADRREFLENEKRLREPTTKSTYATFAEAFADDERGGRFKQTPQHIVGSTPVPQYPAAFLQHDPCGPEPPLGQDLNSVEPCGTAAEVQASIDKLPKPEDDEAVAQMRGREGHTSHCPHHQSARERSRPPRGVATIRNRPASLGAEPCDYGHTAQGLGG